MGRASEDGSVSHLAQIQRQQDGGGPMPDLLLLLLDQYDHRLGLCNGYGWRFSEEGRGLGGEDSMAAGGMQGLGRRGQLRR